MNSINQAHQRVWRWWSAPPPEEIVRDREALLKYELSLIQKAMHDEARGIVAELCNIEAMKPPKPIYIEASLLTAEQVQAMTAADHERAKRELRHRRGDIVKQDNGCGGWDYFHVERVTDHESGAQSLDVIGDWNGLPYGLDSDISLPASLAELVAHREKALAKPIRSR